MKKKLTFMISVIICMGTITACKCKHQWEDATCTQPQICSECEETQGAPLGHTWQNATCTQPQTCTVCGTIEAAALGHTWQDATCTQPQTCSVCKETMGDPLGHSVEKWTTAKEATCKEEGSRKGTCALCKQTVTNSIPKKDHTASDWKITKSATFSNSGEKSKTCKVCNTVLETKSYDLSAEEKKSAFKTECKKYSYDEIARNPDSYESKPAKFTGEVIQVIEEGNEYTLRVNITRGEYFWDDTILVSYIKQDSSEPRILEDDIITMYGTLGGTYTYETIFGSSLTVPLLHATYIEFN